MMPPIAEPIVKPQNINVTSEERRDLGQYSDAIVMVVGIAPVQQCNDESRVNENSCDHIR